MSTIQIARTLSIGLAWLAVCASCGGPDEVELQTAQSATQRAVSPQALGEKFPANVMWTGSECLHNGAQVVIENRPTQEGCSDYANALAAGKVSTVPSSSIRPMRAPECKPMCTCWPDGCLCYYNCQ